MGSLETQRRKIVVLVPFPLQGHITPMLQLGSILHSKGFSIVVAHTEFNSPNPSNHPEFSFLPLPDNLAGDDVYFGNMLNVILDVNENCRQRFEEYMVKMVEEQAMKGGVSMPCVIIIYDFIMSFVDAVAVHLNLPTIVLRTTSAAYIQSHHLMFDLLQQKTIPLPESQMDDPIPNSDLLRFKDLPLCPTMDIPGNVKDFLDGYMNSRSSSAVIWNTVDNLDHSPLLELEQRDKIPFFSIGPFHKMASSSSTSVLKEDNRCLSWLDRKHPNSVIFVSLGSLATIDRNELIEMAWGLANSEQPFLWVIRPSSINDSPSSEWIECLPRDFIERTRERCCIVQWAPQKKILSHSAVGGFLSHCGWNSTLESMCEGVPIICRPCFSDQMINTRYISHVWKVGIELDNVKKDSIEKAVRILMDSEEGKEMRHRAVKMKRDLQQSVKTGGSSYKSLDNLVEFMCSL